MNTSTGNAVISYTLASYRYEAYSSASLLSGTFSEATPISLYTNRLDYSIGQQLFLAEN